MSYLLKFSFYSTNDDLVFVRTHHLTAWSRIESTDFKEWDVSPIFMSGSLYEFNSKCIAISLINEWI